MSIIYALITKDKSTVLVDYSPNSNNIQLYTQELLQKMDPHPQSSITDNQYSFHIINQDGFTYLCAAESIFPQSVAFQYLREIQDLFVKQFSLYERQNAIALAFDSSFKDTLMKKMKEYNSNPGGKEELQKIKNHVGELTNIIHKNIDEVLKREQIIEKAVMKTTKMNESALHIKKQATQARRDAYWRNMRVKIIVAAVVVAFIVTAIIIL